EILESGQQPQSSSRYILSPRMSVDVLQYLVASMPLSSAAVFALTSKTVLRIVGRDYWGALKDPENRKEYLEFLYCIESEFPFHVVCDCCVSLHRRDLGLESVRFSLEF